MVFDTKIKEFLIDAKQKKYGKKGTHEEFKFCEETGECESEQDGCMGC